MKQWFWKEWYELRLLPLASIVCVAVLTFGAVVFVSSYTNQTLQFDDTILPLLATWGLFALLAGATLIAQEIGSGGLQFLSSLPTIRAHIWWVKVVTALGILLLSMLSSLAAWAILDAFWLRGKFFNDPGWTNPSLAPTIGMLLLAALGLFALALAVSPFLDRPMSAVVAALLAAITVAAVLERMGVVYAMQNEARFSFHPGMLDPTSILTVFVALSVPVFAAISYWTFTRGETLRSPKRIRVGALTGAISLTLAGLFFLAGSEMQWW